MEGGEGRDIMGEKVPHSISLSLSLYLNIHKPFGKKEEREIRGEEIMHEGEFRGRYIEK